VHEHKVSFPLKIESAGHSNNKCDTVKDILASIIPAFATFGLFCLDLNQNLNQ